MHVVRREQRKICPLVAVQYVCYIVVQIVVNGVGVDMGMQLTWENRWRTDGSFLFIMKSEHFSWSFGSPGDKKTTWEVRSRTLSISAAQGIH